MAGIPYHEHPTLNYTPYSHQIDIKCLAWRIKSSTGPRPNMDNLRYYTTVMKFGSNHLSALNVAHLLSLEDHTLCHCALASPTKRGVVHKLDMA